MKGTTQRTSLTPEAVAIESVFQIKDRHSKRIVPFKLNAPQRRYDMQRSGRNAAMQICPTRDILNKARQQGMSSIIDAIILTMALVHPHFRAIILAHVSDSSEVLLNKIKFYLENPQHSGNQIDMDFQIDNQTNQIEISPEKTLTYNRKTVRLANKSSIVVTTANNKNTAVGDTVDAIHASETSKWSPTTISGLQTGLLQTLPEEGHLWYESTGDGIGGMFYDLTMAAAKDPEHPYHQHFFPWFETPEYCLKLDKQEELKFMQNVRTDLEEDKLLAMYPFITAGQLKWRRNKLLSEFLVRGRPDLKMFKQEYPSNLIECFQSIGTTVFGEFNYIENSSRWEKLSKHEEIYKLAGHPKLGNTYVAGVDIGLGVKADSTVLDIICVETQEQVFQYKTDYVHPKQAPLKHLEYLRMFNAVVVPEINNHGILYCSVLVDIYPREKIYFEERGDRELEEELQIENVGFATLTGKKQRFIGELSEFLATTDFTIYSFHTAAELQTFQETTSGKLEAASGKFDDCVMSLMLCYVGLVTYNLLPKPVTELYKLPKPSDVPLGILGQKYLGASDSSYLETESSDLTDFNDYTYDEETGLFLN